MRDGFEDLEYLLMDVANKLGFRRGIFTFISEDLKRGYTRAAIGLSEKAKLTELQGGVNGPGYVDLDSNNPFYFALQVGDFPFHSCLNPEYMTQEFSSKSGQSKKQFYDIMSRDYELFKKIKFHSLLKSELLPLDVLEESKTLLAEEIPSSFERFMGMSYDSFKKADWHFNQIYPSLHFWEKTSMEEKRLHYTYLKSKSLVSSPFEEWIKYLNRSDFELLTSQELSFNILFPSFSHFIDINPQIKKRYSMSFEHYMNTLMLGINLAGKLVGVAQFDYPMSTVNYTTPLPKIKQQEAQDQLEAFVPGIVLQGALTDILSNDFKMADDKLHLLSNPSTGILVQIGETSANEVTTTGAKLAPSNLEGTFCIKRFMRGTATTEATARKEYSLQGIKTFPLVGSTEKYIISETVPNLSLYSIGKSLAQKGTPSMVFQDMIKSFWQKISLIRDKNLSLPTEETDYVKKMEEVLFYFVSNSGYKYDSHLINDLSRETTKDFSNTHRKVDLAPRNIFFSIAEIGSCFGYPSKDLDNLLKLHRKDWKSDISNFLNSFYETLEEPSVLQKFLGLEPYLSDYETVERLTYPNDDMIEFIDSPVWSLTLEERLPFFEGVSIPERFYRNARWIIYLNKWVEDENNDKIKLLLEKEKTYHLKTISSLLPKLDPILMQILPSC
ncbi:MAG: hypothetical protein Q8Q35_02625 [Nanoarchaeota archaeon]|nr:hypothetical protein [Nanoarchaeota archaeon]